MKIKTRIQVHKITVAVCGLVFGGSSLATAQEINPQFVNRLLKVQGELKSQVTTQAKSQGQASSPEDYGWGNMNGSGWANATCGDYWANASDDNNGWANAWANC